MQNKINYYKEKIYKQANAQLKTQGMMLKISEKALKKNTKLKSVADSMMQDFQTKEFNSINKVPTIVNFNIKK